jgi:hypothetical protein
MLVFLTAALAADARAEEVPLSVTMPAAGSVSVTDGLAAWDRIHDVFSHPRCSNCHVDAENVPLWSDNSDNGARPHGMNINAGDSRIGVEYLPCSTCHITSTAPNSIANAPPHAGLDWQLAPVEFVWTGRSSAEICAQVKDPDRNGGRDFAGLVEHVTHDAKVTGFISWGFAPGGGREPAPYGLQAHLDDILTWGGAGMPCPTD